MYSSKRLEISQCFLLLCHTVVDSEVSIFRNVVYYTLKTQLHMNLQEHFCENPPPFYRPIYRVFFFFLSFFCKHVSGTDIQYFTQSAERHVVLLVISTCRQPFVQRLSFRSPNGFHCNDHNLMLPRTALSHDKIRTAAIHNTCWTMLTAHFFSTFFIFPFHSPPLPITSSYIFLT